MTFNLVPNQPNSLLQKKIIFVVNGGEEGATEPVGLDGKCHVIPLCASFSSLFTGGNECET